MPNRQNKNIIPAGFISPDELSGMPPDTPVLAGFSGGADSGALLHMLLAWSRRTGAEIFVAHVNHGIRGQEAERDEEFCRMTAEKYRIRLFTCHINVPQIAAETGKSLETAARDERYAFFERIMRENNIPLLAVAHNANDNLETVIFNIARGCALSGVCGIPPVRKCGGGLLIRPILGMSRENILDYCRENGIQYVTDSTNSDTDYSRNHIRADIIPQIKSLNASAERSAYRMSAILRDDEKCLSALAREYYEKHKNPDGSFPIASLCGAQRAVSSRVVGQMFENCGVTVPDRLEYTHINAVLELCARGRAHSSVTLPGQISAVIEDGNLVIGKCIKEDLPCQPQNLKIPLHEGENTISQIDCKIIIGNTHKNINIYKKSIKLYIDSAKIKGTIFMRLKEAGDRIRMGGMSKSLKKLMCDKKIPLSLRGRLPVICDDSGIVAVPMIGVSDNHRINPDDVSSVCIQIYLNYFEQNRKG